MVCVGSVYGLCRIGVWSVYGLCLISVWSVYGLCLISVCSVYGLCMVCVWSVSDQCMVCVGSVYGLCRIGDPSVVVAERSEREATVRECLHLKVRSGGAVLQEPRYPRPRQDRQTPRLKPVPELKAGSSPPVLHYYPLDPPYSSYRH
jgi:hypothetical protein